MLPTEFFSADAQPSFPSGPRAGGWQLALRDLLHSIGLRYGHDQIHNDIVEYLNVALEEPILLANVARFGTKLIETELLEDAEQLYLAIDRYVPRAAAGSFGLAQIATRRKRWGDALSHWTAAIGRAGERTEPRWLVSRCRVLIELGRSDEARQFLHDLTTETGARTAALEALACLEMRQDNWEEATEWWRTLITECGEEVDPSWLSLQATSLFRLGRLDDAEAILRGLLQQDDPPISASVAHARILGSRGRWRQALDIWDVIIANGPSARVEGWKVERSRVLFSIGFVNQAEATLRQIVCDNPASVAALDLLLRLLISTCRLTEARDVFSKTLENADPSVFDCLMHFMPRLFDGWKRTEMWLDLLSRTSKLLKSDLSYTLVVGLRQRLFLALRDYDSFLATFSKQPGVDNLAMHDPRMRAVAAVLRSPEFPDYGASKIFGIGLSKTGTTSLATALTHLGFTTVDWVNTLTGEMMNHDDLFLFDAFTDTPCCLNFEENYFRFPNSKFIYTLRDKLIWSKSILDHKNRHYGIEGFEKLKTKIVVEKQYDYGKSSIDLHTTLYLNFESYIDAFESYDRRVRNFFMDKPRDRFLEFDIFSGDRWPKLCAFLGKPIPTMVFPWENRAPNSSSHTSVTSDRDDAVADQRKRVDQQRWVNDVSVLPNNV